jgi:hypothetical protein
MLTTNTVSKIRRAFVFAGSCAALLTIYAILHYHVIFGNEYFPGRYEDAFRGWFVILNFWAGYGVLAFVYLLLFGRRRSERPNQARDATE